MTWEWLISSPVHPDLYIWQIILLLSGCMILALGIYLQVSANVLMNPGEGLVQIIAGKNQDPVWDHKNNF